MSDRLRHLDAFLRVLDHGSLSGAARELGVGQSTVSKWLASLERELGAPLLDRTTRSLRLTADGEALRPYARRLVDGWSDARAAVGVAERVEGPLRVSLPTVFGELHVLPHVGGFLDAHPGVALDLALSDRYVALVEEGFDLALRIGGTPDSTLRARRLASPPRRLVASPAYLARRGRPEHPRELSGHEALVHSGVRKTVWTFERGGTRVRATVRGRARADHSGALRQLCLQGQGIALLADWLVGPDLDHGRLQLLMDDWTTAPAPILALLPPSRQVPRRVRAFIEHLQGAWPWTDGP